jgi:hypothetical protein
LSLLHAVCTDIATQEHAAIAAAKRFLLDALGRVGGRDDRDTPAHDQAVAALAGYVRPIAGGEDFQALRSSTADSEKTPIEASPLWRDHDIMRVRPHR